MGGRPLAFYHSCNWVPSRRYRGALGVNASVKALEASAPTTILPRFADINQNIFDDVWSRLAAYVLPSYTVPCMRGEPLHGEWAFLVPSSFNTYFHRKDRKLASCGMGTGLKNMPCFSYWSSCLCSASFQRFQSCCTLRSRRVSLAFFFADFIVAIFGVMALMYLRWR